jgi:N6-adenosine-specific RNA methylase IME4
MQLKIDPEFKSLIPPLSDDERAELRASLQTEGCRDALVVWGETIIDGHNRYELCGELAIPFKTMQREFETRDHVIVWIVLNQLARRNITQYAKDELMIDHLKPAEDRIGKQRMSEAAKGLPETNKPSHDTQKKLADKAGTSKSGMQQSTYIAKKAPDAIKKAAREGEMSRNRAYEITRHIEKLPEAHREKAAALCMDHDRKAETLARLHKSSGSPETNGTFDEIMSTGGFHYGDDLEKWRDFQNDSMKQISDGLLSIAKHHAREQRQARQEQRQKLAKSLEGDIFNAVLVDPPWQYSVQNVNGAANNHYDTMPIEDICSLLDDMSIKIADNAVLFMWVTNPFLVKALEVVEAWGFEYKTNIVWVKTKLVKPGAGHYIRGRHELLYICTRGIMTPLVDVSPPIGSVLTAPIQEHSRKPDEVYSIIERLYPNCNYLELFARRPRDGWGNYGDIK